MKNKVKTIKVGASILKENDKISEENRLLFEKNNVCCINVMGSPGSGKTSLLEKTIPKLKLKNIKPGVIEGDIEGTLDGERLLKYGIPVVQINTGGACHLDANMVKKGLENLNLNEIDILFIENVGNLVCPAAFTLGESYNVIISSCPEGEEKPLKYPLMFNISNICLLNKMDLSEHLDFNTKQFKEYLFKVAPDTKLIPLSSKTGDGFEEWLDFLYLSAPENKKERIVVVGLGDRMKGDDAAGCEIAEQLHKEDISENVKIINAENAIENYIGVIKGFKPDRIYFVDAVDFSGTPGEVRLMEAGSLVSNTSSTHTLALPLIIENIKAETSAKCTIVGVQPKKILFSQKISNEVREGIMNAVKMLREILWKKR
ncbi:hydrogenase nickel incorporation protein HypB [bacterium]|nr:hydrogenase nickel incorporation protein HypB [bacterium]